MENDCRFENGYNNSKIHEKKTNIKDENQNKTNKNKQIPPATQIYYQQMGDYQ